jgi:SAM-dependent methyltransferase
MFNELVRHPIIAARFIKKRIMEIPSKGLPRFRKPNDDEFDKKHGVETSKLVQFVPTNSENVSHGNRYSAASESVIRWCIENCGMPLESTTFVDVGSGKGRALIVATFYPLKKIVGVEYSSELAEICCKNLLKMGLQSKAEVVVCDAAEFCFPDGDLLVFLYNPFDGVILERVLKTLAAASGRVRIAQLGPGHEIIRRSGLAREICSGDGPTIYEILNP